MKRPTKQQITAALRSGNKTEIFKIAHLCGVNTKNRKEVLNFIKGNAPSDKIYSNAYDLAYSPFKERFYFHNQGQPFFKPVSSTHDAVEWAKWQKAKCADTNYFKTLHETKNGYWWASPSFGMADYNKAFALPINEKCNRVATIINKYLMK